jgi:hypothetical protein
MPEYASRLALSRGSSHLRESPRRVCACGRCRDTNDRDWWTILDHSAGKDRTRKHFSTTRPVKIELANIETNGVETPIQILNQDQWAAISDKSQTSDNPLAIYYEETYPLGTINFWPVPSSTNNLVLHSWKRLTTFTSTATTLAFPPGYERMLTHLFAIEFAPEFGKQCSPEVIQIAMDSKAQIKRQNTKPSYLVSDIGQNKPFNLLTGE